MIKIAISYLVLLVVASSASADAFVSEYQPPVPTGQPAADKSSIPPRTIAEAELVQVLTCNKATTPERLLKVLAGLDGLLVTGTSIGNAEYTIPNPVEVFGTPVTQISIRPNSNAEGDFTEYSALLGTESIFTVAKYADITPDSALGFKKPVGSHDLSLRAESGFTYVVCGQHVRSAYKTMKRWGRQSTRAVKETVDELTQ